MRGFSPYFILLIGVGLVVFYFKKIRSKIMKKKDKLSTRFVPETANEYNRINNKSLKDVLTIRSKNPGAIFWFGDNWQGLDKEQTKHGAICYFDDYQNGIRAQVRTLFNYQQKHGLYTISSIVNRYAPAGVHGNNPGSYAKFLSEFLGVDSDQRVVFSENPEFFAKLAYGIHIFEAGFAWINLDSFVKWVEIQLNN